LILFRDFDSVYLSVIIPAYNEEKNIEKTIRSVFGYLKDKNIEHEIIVVTDGSEDKTNEIVRTMLSSVPTLQLIDNPRNMGKGYVVRQGMLKAKGEYRLFTDADNATSVDHIEKMIPYLKDGGYGVAIGSIGLKEAKVASGSEPVWRLVFGKMGNFFIQAMVVPGIHDTQRGFKILTARAAEDIFSRMRINRWGFDIEMLGLARKLGYKIKEVAVNWKNDPNSHVSFKAYFQVLVETIKIKWNLITGKYNK